MKRALYAGLVLGLVPIQTTVLQYASIGGIRPDLCLIAVCLVGFVAGEREGMLLGFALGLIQDLFSAGDPGLNLVTKGLIGFLAGLVGKLLANVTPVAMLATLLGLSVVSGTVFLMAVRVGEGLADLFFVTRSVLLPQALFDAAVGTGAYWLIARRGQTDQATQEKPGPLW